MSIRTEFAYFIRFEFIPKMKDVLPEGKEVYYGQNFRIKFRDKLKNSYLKTNSLSEFYNDAFDLLNNFEEEYLLLNLFFEEDAETIINGLNKNLLQDLVAKKEKTHYFSKYKKHLYETLGKKKYQNSDFEEFIISEFEELTEISIKKLDLCNPQQHPLQHEFAVWLANNLKTECSFSAIIIYAKIWQLYFSRPFANIKAIVFLDCFISKTKELDFNFSYYVDKAIDLISLIFYNNISFPLIENLSVIKGASDGYKSKKNQLVDLLHENKLFHTDFSNLSYSNLYKVFLEATDLNLKQKIIKSIYKKIDLNIMPTEEDFDFIKRERKDSNNFTETFNATFYLYQNLRF